MFGITNILKKYENIIVIEDDCIPFKNFFNFIAGQLQTDYFKKEYDNMFIYVSYISESNSKNFTLYH